MRGLIKTAVAAFGLILLLSTSSSAGERIPLRVGFLVDRDRFDRTYAEKDIKLATQVLFGRILAQDGEFAPTFNAFRTTTRYIEAIRNGELDYIEMDPLFFLRLPEDVRETVQPLSVVQLGEKRLEKFLLLASPGETIESLAGKRLRIDSGTDRGISSLWMNYELQQLGAPVLEEHFGGVQVLRKSEDVLLPTFFGKADACIIREEDYAVAVELNPQIGKRLIPIKVSPEFPLIMTATTGSNAAEIASRIGGAPKAVINQTGSQQAFALLRIKDIGPFKEGDLKPLKKIVDAIEKKGELTAVDQAEVEAE